MQTPEEREVLLAAGRDGLIFCLDLDDVQGQAAANLLKEHCCDVRRALGLRDLEDELRYLIALMPRKATGRAVVRLATYAALPEAIEHTWHRSKDFGTTYTVAIVPRSPDIAELFTTTHLTIIDVVGNA